MGQKVRQWSKHEEEEEERKKLLYIFLFILLSWIIEYHWLILLIKNRLDIFLLGAALALKYALLVFRHEYVFTEPFVLTRNVLAL